MSMTYLADIKTKLINYHYRPLHKVSCSRQHEQSTNPIYTIQAHNTNRNGSSHERNHKQIIVFL